MSKLIPDYVFDSIYDITPEVLTAHGVRGVLVDLDGTMASHKAALPPDTLHTFVDRLKNAGIAVLVFSNNHPERVGKFCEPFAWAISAMPESRFRAASARRQTGLACPCARLPSSATRFSPTCSAATAQAR